AAAFDAARGHLVVVGGVTDQGLDGSAWQRNYQFFVSDSWAEIQGAPPARAEAAMAFDAARGVLVMFGGDSSLIGGAYVGDTLEYDGTAWTKRTPLVSPPARRAASMYYDPLRQRIVMFGGVASSTSGETPLGDTWEYDGSTWLQITGSGPSPRGGAAIAWDDDRGRAVLYGGSVGTSYVGDTWERVGTTWSAITTSVGPQSRTATAMAFLPARHAVVLFGGDLFFGKASDTWEYDASGWRQVTGGATTPPGRTGHTLTYDASEGTLVLVGGASADFFDDIWHYQSDGTWQQLDPDLGTPRAALRSLVFDAQAREPLLFAGIESTTWAFANGRWELRSAAPSEAMNVVTAGATYMPGVGVLEVGGFGPSGVVDRVWAWRDGQWTELTATPRPSARMLAAMAYSPNLGRTVLFGGATDPTGATAFGDTWELDGTSWHQSTGGVHPDAQAGVPMVYDPTRQQLVLVDVQGVSWGYDAGGWTQIATTSALTPPRRFSNAVYDRRRDSIEVFGGITPDGQVLGDAWELRDGTWTKIADSGPMLVTRGLALDEVTGTVIMFGGTNASTSDGTTWLFDRRSATPDEVCANGIDDDSDRMIDGDDPDCL
ncbi:MAG TPA: kelch repeat-containing protein, partial [Kofleriaceae bacterium]|nr:kelch repeat-containing protein [Kofleriaceae bacterium]